MHDGYASLIAQHSTEKNTDPHVTCVLQTIRQDDVDLSKPIKIRHYSDVLDRERVSPNYRILSVNQRVRSSAAGRGFKISDEELHPSTFV